MFPAPYQEHRILCRTSVVSGPTNVIICSKYSTLPSGESISTCISSISTSISRNLFVVWFVMILFLMGGFRAPVLSYFFRSPRSFFELFQRVRHRERMDLSLSQYADNTTKQIVAEPGEDVQALAKRVRCSNDVFDRALAHDGCSQNRGKEELLMHLVGTGSLADRRLVREGQVSLPGKVVTVARHLGSHLGGKGIFHS